MQRVFSLVSRHLERTYGEGWITVAKNKDTGKMSKLIIFITEDEQGLVWSSSRPKIHGGVYGGCR